VKLTLVGAGGFRTPAIYRALVAGAGTTRFDEVVLFDPNAERLEQIGAVLAGIDAELGDRVVYRSSGDLRDALEGADVVYCAIRVGGLEGRLLDERIAVDAGAIGQETTGAGGIAFALRTVPAATAIAEQVARHAPDALFINFTNPAGLVTEALQRVLGDRVVGICDAPPDMCQRVATAVGMPVDQLWFDYFGINHLGWLRSVRHRERDLLPGLLADDDRLARFEEGRLFGGEWLRAVGMLPNEYLYYYYFEREALDAMRDGHVRAAWLRGQQAAFYERDDGAPKDALALWQKTLTERESTYMDEAWDGRTEQHHDVTSGREPGGYGGLALGLVDALHSDGQVVRILDVANRSSLPFLDEDAIVEVPCVVGRGGIVPVAIGDVPIDTQGLMLQVRAADRVAIDAALSGSRQLAIKALALNPLVHSVVTATRILDGYLAQQPALRAMLK
jgi:6-phospho-beta-glucosidase